MEFVSGRFLPHLAMILAGASLGAGCVKKGSESAPETVAIRQTEVKNQFSIGFCWAYTLAGLIESIALKERGLTVDISEESIGFYLILEKLFSASQKYGGTELASGFDEVLMPIDSSSVIDGLEMSIGKYGVIPEKAWSYKFEDSGSAAELRYEIKRRFLKLMEGKRAGSLSREEIVKGVLVGAPVFPSQPPLSFAGENGTQDSLTYLRETLGFHPERYGEISSQWGQGPYALASAIGAIKRSLVRGIPVPLAVPVAESFLSGIDLVAKGAPWSDIRFMASWGHAMLVTDFVNRGGTVGGAGLDVLEKEVQKSVEELDYLVVKNSWGTTRRSVKAPTLTPGLGTIDLAYLVGINAGSTRLRIIVPKDIAADPLGREPIAAVVGPIECPAGYTLESVGEGKMCGDGRNALGPFTEAMKQKCLAWSPQDPVCSGNRWGWELARSARGTGVCPEGATLDSGTSYCVEGANAFGPFPKALVEKCRLRSANDTSACDSARWDRNFLKDLLGP